jgi:hypothetical protein
LDVGNPGNDGYYGDDETKPIQIKEDGTEVRARSNHSTWADDEIGTIIEDEPTQYKSR